MWIYEVAVDTDHSGIDLSTKAWNNYLIRGGLRLESGLPESRA